MSHVTSDDRGSEKRSSAGAAEAVAAVGAPVLVLRLMDKILHDLKDSKLWELWYIPYNG